MTENIYTVKSNRLKLILQDEREYTFPPLAAPFGSSKRERKGEIQSSHGGNRASLKSLDVGTHCC